MGVFDDASDVFLPLQSFGIGRETSGCVARILDNTALTRRPLLSSPEPCEGFRNAIRLLTPTDMLGSDLAGIFKLRGALFIRIRMGAANCAPSCVRSHHARAAMS